MSIGGNIKRMRRERGITQEKLAELLGLTPSAVSQWETDRVLPDISQLPVLAEIFDVTSDEILGIEGDSREARIAKISDEASACSLEKRYSDAVEILRRGCERFPESDELCYDLAETLFMLYYPECPPEVEQERIRLYEKVLSISRDEYYKNYSIGNLCILYRNAGRIDEAKALVEQVPDPYFSYKRLRLYTLGGTMEWAYEACEQIKYHFIEMIGIMCSLARVVKYAMDDCEALELWRKVTVFIETFYEKGDYFSANEYLMEAYLGMAERYAAIGETDNALYSLEKMLVYTEELGEWLGDYRGGYEFVSPIDHSSILVRKCEKEHFFFDEGKSTAAVFLDRLNGGGFDAIRAEPRFKAVEEALVKMK